MGKNFSKKKKTAGKRFVVRITRQTLPLATSKEENPAFEIDHGLVFQDNVGGRVEDFGCGEALVPYLAFSCSLRPVRVGSQQADDCSRISLVQIHLHPLGFPVRPLQWLSLVFFFRARVTLRLF